MEQIPLSQHTPHQLTGQYTFHEQGTLLDSVLIHPSTETSLQSNSSEGISHVLSSSDGIMINSARPVNEVSKSNRRFTIGTPVHETHLISHLFEDRLNENATMADPTNNLWRRTYQNTLIPVRGLSDGSTWEQNLTNDTIRPFSSPGCLSIAQNGDWSTSTTMKEINDNDNERLQQQQQQNTNTAENLTFFEQLTSTDITDDHLREVSPENYYDGLHGQRSNLMNDEAINASTESNALLCSTIIKPKKTTTTKTARKTKKEKDPNRLADRRKRRRESHNAVERRRRDLINDRIAELAMLLPKNDLMDAIAHSASGGTMPHINLKPFLQQRRDLLHDSLFVEDHQLEAIAQSKPNKGIILTKAVEYIRYLRHACAMLRQDNERLQATARFDNQHL